MNQNTLAARENWSSICGLRDLTRVGTRTLPMAVLCLVVFCAFPSANRAQVPVYEVTPVESTIKFGVESSVPIKGTFDKWNASMKFSSADVRSSVLEIEIQADSVNTGSGLKNNKLKGKDFFNAQDSPTITFKSTKVVHPVVLTVERHCAVDASGSRSLTVICERESFSLRDPANRKVSFQIECVRTGLNDFRRFERDGGRVLGVKKILALQFIVF